ncbi:MAG: hypothetical protein M0Q43_09390 [Methanothrix sp.]|nr:hypothetical protein [Methanothrix sp.]
MNKNKRDIKVGQNWIVFADDDPDTFWRVQIVAKINHRKCPFYLGIKHGTDFPVIDKVGMIIVFDQCGNESVLGKYRDDTLGFYLARLSKSKRTYLL